WDLFCFYNDDPLLYDPFRKTNAGNYSCNNCRGNSWVSEFPQQQYLSRVLSAHFSCPEYGHGCLVEGRFFRITNNLRVKLKSPVTIMTGLYNYILVLFFPPWRDPK